MANINAGENNYDKYWDAKQQKKTQKAKPASSKKRLAFVGTFLVIALIAVIAVSMSVAGIGENTTVASKTYEGEKLMANAEPSVQVAETSESAAEEEMKAPAAAVGGENYILLANGEVMEVVLPERVVKAKEEENKFDRFCSWLNGAFGG